VGGLDFYIVDSGSTDLQYATSDGKMRGGGSLELGFKSLRKGLGTLIMEKQYYIAMGYFLFTEICSVETGT